MFARRIVKYLVVIALLLGGGSGFAQSLIDSSVKLFSKVEVFAFGGVGYAGQTSAGEIDFKTILSLPPQDALAVFEKLVVTGNPQAKAYALSGMRKINPRRFQELFVVAEESREDVAVMRSCVLTTESLRDVAEKIDRGEWDLYLKRDR